MSFLDAFYKFVFTPAKAVAGILFDEFGVPVGTVDNPLITGAAVMTMPAKSAKLGVSDAKDYEVLRVSLELVELNQTTGDIVVLCDTLANSSTVLLPSASSSHARFTFKKTSAANVLVVAPARGETIDGALKRELSVQFETLCLVSDGTSWLVV